MLRFKTYVRYLEEAVLFSVNLTPAEWDKRPERFDKLRTAMKDKIKIIHFISKTNQREMIVKDTTDNKKIIKDLGFLYAFGQHSGVIDETITLKF